MFQTDSMADRLISGQEKGIAEPEVQELYQARVKESLPWIASPLDHTRKKQVVTFFVRQETSMLELFFDLFFVANLSTFTQYHEITSGPTVYAYIGFFLILWSTWYQITLFDVRFASDSVFERSCKMFQMIIFVVFAACGTYFSPGTKDSVKYFRIYEMLSVTLAASRWLLAVQYTVMAMYIVPKFKKLWLPFALIVVTLIGSGATFFATKRTFDSPDISASHFVWWITLPVESIIVVGISSYWRMLSFKETHMQERLFLLTIIILGEGVIGLSKVVGKLWPADETLSEGSAIAVFSVVILLFLLWQSYYDTHPHGYYGTIGQQWWSLAHVFLHLGYVGISEGANHMATFYFSMKKINDSQNQIINLCTAASNNATFIAAVNTTITQNELRKYDPRGYDTIQRLFNIDMNGAGPSMCASDLPISNNASTRFQVIASIRHGLLQKFAIELPDDTTNNILNVFKLTFTYTLSSIALTLLTGILFIYIVRRGNLDRYEYIRMGWRFGMALLTVSQILLQLSESFFLSYLSSPLVVLSVCCLMGTILVVDRICRSRALKCYEKEYQTPISDSDMHEDEVEKASIVLRTMASNSSATLVAKPSNASLAQNSQRSQYTQYTQYTQYPQYDGRPLDSWSDVHNGDIDSRSRTASPQLHFL